MTSQALASTINHALTPRARTAGAMPAHIPTAQEQQDGGFLSIVKTVIDVINPLHHIPIVGSVYRHFTGDEINPAAQVAGSALYGGPLGAATGVASVAFEGMTGRGVGDTAVALAFGGGAAAVTAVSSAGHDIAARDNLDTSQYSKAPVILASDIIWEAPVPKRSLPVHDPQPVPAAAISHQMMRALDAYGAMKKDGLNHFQSDSSY